MTPEQRAARRAADLDAAVDSLTVAGSVGLALRDHRRRLGLSQRAYAAMRDWSASRVARLESDAGRFSLDDVVDALEGTAFGIALVRRAPDESSPVAVVDPRTWRESELVARVRDGSRRFPAHHEVQAVSNPPTWWWHREFFVRGLGSEPEWYAPRPPPVVRPHRRVAALPPEHEQPGVPDTAHSRDLPRAGEDAGRRAAGSDTGNADDAVA